MNHYALPSERDFEKCFGNLKSHLIILENKRGMTVALSDYGARVVSILVPDKNGKKVDVALGYNHIDEYLNSNGGYQGATVGRFANRIARGTFKVDGITYRIEPNNGTNALHGGKNGFHSRVWSRRVNNRHQVEFYLISPDGEEGFPGNLTVVVQYSLTEDNELRIQYRAKTDKNTIINLTNHTFFNLNGEGAESIYNHQISIDADSYLPVDANLIPTGELRPCKDTAFDFISEKSIGEQIIMEDDQIKSAGGFDHNYVLNNTDYGLEKPVAEVLSPLTGIQMEVYTDQPGMQFYTGNFLGGNDAGKCGKPYLKHGAFCLETQGFPDAPNQETFPSCLLKVGEAFNSETRYRFKVVK
jgi:aldose 1-epimerase